MFRLSQWVGVLALAGWMLGGVSSAVAQAQRRGRVLPQTPFGGPANFNEMLPGIAPFFRVAPGLNLSQAAYNTTVMGRAFQNFPAYAMPYAAPYAIGYSPFSNPGVAYPGTATNPYLNAFANNLLYSNPYLYGGGYGGASMSSMGYSPYSSGGIGGGYGGYGYYQDPFNGYLTGAAGVIQGQGSYMVSAQQANLLKQQVQREKIENRKRVIDEWLYERAVLPTAEDLREEVLRAEVRRAQNDPPWTEKLSAKSLNDLLADLQRLRGRGVEGPAIPLEEDVLAQVNVGPAGDGAAAPFLKDGRFSWPALLRRPEFQPARDELTSLLREAARQAAGRQVDAILLEDGGRLVGQLKQRVRELVKAQSAEGIPPGPYGQAMRFLRQLEDGLKVLQRPDADKYVTAAYAARGKTVADLVGHMTAQGLWFAPAVGGDEAAYTAVHRALADYSIAAHLRAEDGAKLRPVRDSRGN
jgi:hypothetical protein